MAKLYTAQIEYNETTIREMDKTLQNAFKFHKKVILMVVCLCFLIVGVNLTASSNLGLILVIGGCLIAPYASFYTTPSQSAISSIDALKGNSFIMRYELSEDKLTCFVNEKKTVEYPYTSFIRIIETEKYLYLCTSVQQACMIDLATVKPNARDKFIAYVEGRIGLQRTKPFSWFTYNFKTLRFNRKNTRKP